MYRLETAKNICLAGVKEVTIHDPTLARRTDQNGNFYIDRTLGCDEDGLLLPHCSRAELTAVKLQTLNPNVGVHANWEPAREPPEIEKLISGHNVVIVTDMAHSLAIKFNQCCRSAGIKFVAAEVFNWWLHTRFVLNNCFRCMGCLHLRLPILEMVT